MKLCREQQQFRITWELRVRCCEPVAGKKGGAEKAGGGREKMQTAERDAEAVEVEAEGL